jgi:hypothetical protein
MMTLNSAQLKVVDWLNEQLRYNNVPRLVDIKRYVHQEGIPLTNKQVAQLVRLQPQYKRNMPQQRMASRSRAYRPVVVSELGHLHADIGYFSINSRYETPVTYRAGYLIAKDILSRQIYATPLLKNKTADSLISGFKKIFEQQKQYHVGSPIRSIAFDKEASVMSKKVQTFFKSQNITFHAFNLSSSKAKFAEGAIRQVREVMKRLLERGNKKDRWWNLLPVVVNILNNQEVIVNKKALGYTPNQVTAQNVEDFKKKLQKAVPAYYFAQFDIAPSLVSFDFQVGALVRAKLIATSSDVLGNKRSEMNLTDQVFVVEKRVPYITRKMTVGKAYKCRDIKSGDIEIFQEDEIALTTTDGDDDAWRQAATLTSNR